MAPIIRSASPVIRRPDTGCRVTLGAGIMPQAISHNEKKCKCIPAETPEQLSRVVDSARNAMEMDGEAEYGACHVAPGRRCRVQLGCCRVKAQGSVFVRMRIKAPGGTER
ncbi:Uu.00g011700.m01.CDS01 [Anthostomella pinea]|uniref:Uu.00g011700.m01.CDS01 n=1 Tax=Anthostomella pinea TaxID=933095 RepID=A0AAI8VXT3_9PEZI|nr:Uu.00g011700.m01.CDS01 [Anthostomella pinea]